MLTRPVPYYLDEAQWGAPMAANTGVALVVITLACAAIVAGSYVW
jgi:hypothetical protein